MALMPRFVLLYHDCPPKYSRPSHWDLMLETGNLLRTWALEKLPYDWSDAQALTHSKDPHCPALAESNHVAAEQLADHRKDYLEFEGDLTGDRGRVIRIAAGTYEIVAESANGFEIVTIDDNISRQIRLTRLDAESTQWRLGLQVTS
jgi:hypothetical protein